MKSVSVGLTMMERNPLAPVFLSMACWDMASMASGVNDNSTWRQTYNFIQQNSIVYNGKCSKYGQKHHNL